MKEREQWSKELKSYGSGEKLIMDWGKPQILYCFPPSHCQFLMADLGAEKKAVAKSFQQSLGTGESNIGVHCYQDIQDWKGTCSQRKGNCWAVSPNFPTIFFPQDVFWFLICTWDWWPKCKVDMKRLRNLNRTFETSWCHKRQQLEFNVCLGGGVLVNDLGFCLNPPRDCWSPK